MLTDAAATRAGAAAERGVLARVWRTARVILAIAAGAALTWLLLGATPESASGRISSIVSIIAGSNPRMIAAAAAMYAGSLLLRAWRWKALAFRSPAPLGRILPVTAIHAGLGHVLPVRLSDVAVVGLLRTSAGVPLGEGAATIIMSKLLDLASMGLVILLALVWGLEGTLALVSAGLLVTGTIGMLALPRILGRLERPLGRVLRPGGRAASFYTSLISACGLWSHSRSRFAAASAISVAAWGLKLGMFVALTAAVRLEGIPVWQVFFAGALTDLIMAVPVHGLFSLGTAEAGWAAGFALAGVTGERVIVAGFGVHLIWMAMAVTCMLVSLPLVAQGRAGSSQR
jgi:hypothetical protein